MKKLANDELQYVVGGQRGLAQVATAAQGCFVGGSAAYSTYPSTASTTSGCVAGAGVALLGGGTTAQAAAGTAAGLAALNAAKDGAGGDDGSGVNWDMVGASQMTASYGGGQSGLMMLLVQPQG